VPEYSQELERGIRGLKSGPARVFCRGMDAEVEQAVCAGIETLRGLGAELSTCHCRTRATRSDLLHSRNAEASSNLARYDGVRYGVRTTPATNLLEMYMPRAEGLALK